MFKNLDEEIDIDETRDFLTVFLPVEIEPQSITLVICFQGKLNNGVQGFIRLVAFLEEFCTFRLLL